MNGPVVDLVRVRNALAELDRLVADHPERCNRNGPKWADHLPELDKLTMGTPVKQRIKDYRARLRAKGYKAATIYLPDGIPDRLAQLSQETGLPYGDVVALALDCYEHRQDGMLIDPPAEYKAPDTPQLFDTDAQHVDLLPPDRAALAAQGHALLADGLTATAIAGQFNVLGWTPDKVPKAVGFKPRADSPAAWTAKLVSQLLNRDHPAQPDREAAP